METNTAELIENLRRSQAENGRVEVKAAAGGFPKSVLETVSAFANGDGGTILLGLIDPAEGLQPVEGFNAQAVHDASVEAIRSKITPRPPVDIHIEAVDDQHRIVRIDVLPGDPTQKPYYIEAHGMYNGSYQRVGEADIRLTKYEIDRLVVGGVGACHEGGVDAEAAQGHVQLGDGAAVQLRGGDDVVALLAERREGDELGSHAGGGRHRADTAFEGGDALLQRGDGGVGQARVDVAVLLQGEEVCRIVSVFEDEGGGLVDGDRAGSVLGVGGTTRVQCAGSEAESVFSHWFAPGVSARRGWAGSR